MRNFQKKLIVGGLLSSIFIFMFIVSFVQAKEAGQVQRAIIPEIDQQETAAPTPQPTIIPEVFTYANNATFQFKVAGQTTITMYYPSSHQFDITFPNRWAVAGGIENSYVEFHYDLYDDWLVEPTIVQNNPFMKTTPYVAVIIDDVLAGAFLPESGTNHLARVPIPVEILMNREYNPTNAHVIQIDWYRDNDTYCLFNGILKIHDDSAFKVAFKPVKATLSLGDYPRPIVMDSFIPETLFIILPDFYNENDIATAATISSSIGKNTTGNVKLSVITASQANQEVLKNFSAVIIGQPNRNGYLARLYAQNLLPTGLSKDNNQIVGFGITDIGSEDGVIQLIPNEFNSVNNYLIITGESDQAVKRAGEALENPPVGLTGQIAVIRFNSQAVDEMMGTPAISQPIAGVLSLTPTKSPTLMPEMPTSNATSSGQVIRGVTPTGVIKSATSPTPTPAVPAAILGFNKLNFTERDVYGLGTYQISVPFYIPRNWEVTGGAKVVVNYIHSLKLSSNNSNISVELNNTPIGTAAIDSTRQGEKQAIIPINKSDLLIGSLNLLRFTVTLSVPLDCAVYDLRANWLRIRSSSFIYLPYFVVPDEAITAPVIHPYIQFAYEPDIFIGLPANPNQQLLNGMATFFFYQGKQQQTGFNIQVSMDPNYDLSLVKGYHILLLGKPTENPLIAQVNSYLPQQFIPGEDALKQQVGNITYRVIQDFSIGIIEAIPVPWDRVRTLTVFTGTSDEGME